VTEAETVSTIPAPARALAIGLESASFWLFIVILAWAPFPLGSNRAWSWSLLCVLVMLCWFLWCASVWSRPQAMARLADGIRIPLLLGGFALLWGIVQALPIVPESWTHPVWQMAGSVLGTHPAGTISLDPWRTGTEVMKLATYGMALLLVREFARRAERANVLLNAFIMIGGIYAAYALIIASVGFVQFNLFYPVPALNHDVSGPFVNHNSYATYAGLGALAAGVRLVEKGSVVVTARGFRTFALTLTQYVFGRGAPYLLALILTVSTLIATGSRGGNTAFVAGAVSILLLSVILGARRSRAVWTGSIAFAFVAGFAVLFSINGNILATHFDDLAGSGIGDETRQMLWGSAVRMIEDAPLLGLGLGNFQNAYPMYSDVTMRFVMDKAHNDYLELAAGWGLPAAILWLSAIGWSGWLCARGVLRRRRHRAYPMLAVGASVLVGVHSVFDFSLQMPAIAFTYACILGLGLAQAFSTRETG
jgi:O-antigen ligase